MSEFIYIYAYTALQNAEDFLWGMYFFGALGAGFVFVGSAVGADFEYGSTEKIDSHKALKKGIGKLIKSKLVIAPFIVLSLLSVFVPSKDDVKTIIAGGLAWKAGQSVSEIDGINELPDNIINAMNSFLIGIDKGEKKD